MSFRRWTDPAPVPLGTPQVTVLTTTFNHERYIAQCISSVREQTNAQWELIVLDDGSSDQTCRRALEAAGGDPRIAVYSRPNAGPAELHTLYNFGLSLARGSLIAILEGDDWWPADKLERQLAALQHDTVLSFGKCQIVDPLGRPLREPRSRFSLSVLENQPPGEALRAFGQHRNFIPAVTCVVRRDALERVGGFLGGLGMLQVDFPTWSRLALEGPFQYVDRVLGVWRRVPTSITSTKLRQMVETREAFLRELRAGPGAHLPAEWFRAPSDAELLLQEARMALSFEEYGRAGRLGRDAFRQGGSFDVGARGALTILSAILHMDLFAGIARFLDRRSR